jgi:hypothetical protein
VDDETRAKGEEVAVRTEREGAKRERRFVLYLAMWPLYDVRGERVTRCIARTIERSRRWSGGWSACGRKRCVRQHTLSATPKHAAHDGGKEDMEKPMDVGKMANTTYGGAV